MGNTIEERAKIYEPDAFDADEIIPAREGHIVDLIRLAYINGATEQKEIDDSLLNTKVKLEVDCALATAFIENVKEKNELLENIYNWLYENATTKYMVDNQKLVGGDMVGDYYYDYETLVEDLKKYLGDKDN